MSRSARFSSPNNWEEDTTGAVVDGAVAVVSSTVVVLVEMALAGKFRGRGSRVSPPPQPTMTTASDKAPGPSRESRYFSTCPSLRPLHIVHACLQSEHRASCLIQSSLIVAATLRTAVPASDFAGPQRTLAFGLDAGGKLISGSRITADRAISRLAPSNEGAGKRLESECRQNVRSLRIRRRDAVPNNGSNDKLGSPMPVLQYHCPRSSGDRATAS